MGRVDPDKAVYVYGLHTEADETIMYVGCSVNPEKRLKQHLGLALQGYAPKRLGAWLISCVEWGQTITFSVLESCKASEAQPVEEKWINKTRSVNPNLTNHQWTSPYSRHINAKERTNGLRPASNAGPGDTVIHMRNAYADGHAYQELIAAKVIRSGNSYVLVGETVNGHYQERWIPPHRLYEPPSPQADRKQVAS